MSDLISRQDAIDVFEILADKMSDEGQTVMAQVVAVLKDLHPAEPERIIKIGQRSGKTLESAIDYLHSVGWLQEHDRILTESAEPERRWIPVTEALPKNYEQTICIDSRGKMMIGMYGEYGWTFPCYMTEPVAWMPLPEPWRGE